MDYKLEEAIVILEQKGLYSEAYLLLWRNFKSKTFKVLYSYGFKFNSTETALLKLLKFNQSKGLELNLFYLYEIAVLCDVNSGFELPAKEYRELKNTIKKTQINRE